jgi:hypothetical protein
MRGAVCEGLWTVIDNRSVPGHGGLWVRRFVDCAGFSSPWATKTGFPIFDVFGLQMTARHPATICEWFRGDMGVHWKDVLGEQRKPKGWRYVSRRLSRVR